MYTRPEKEREKKTEITNLTNATVTKETNKVMTRVLTDEIILLISFVFV